MTGGPKEVVVEVEAEAEAEVVVEEEVVEEEEAERELESPARRNFITFNTSCCSSVDMVSIDAKSLTSEFTL